MMTKTDVLLRVIESLAEKTASINKDFKALQKENEEYKTMFARVVQEKIVMEQELSERRKRDHGNN